MGFTVEQIGDLLALWSDRSRASADVKTLALGHVEVLRAKISEVEAMVATLETLALSCHGDNRPDCPIIKGLEHGVGAPLPTPSPRRLEKTGLMKPP